MNKELFIRESKYESRMAVARTMVKNGLISACEYRHINAAFLEKYRPLLGNLRTDNLQN